MNSNTSLGTVGAVLLAIAVATLTFVPKVVAASKYKVLYTFKGKPDGAHPTASLVLDAAGNLYGTTYAGGGGSCQLDDTVGCGVIFKLKPPATPSGSWTESVLYRFCSLANCADGDSPYAGLIVDAAGNLYGTTAASEGTGYGTVFKLTPNSDGSWTESVLYSFLGDGGNGGSPTGGVILDASGNLYGTTAAGGTYGEGTVFELTPNSNGTWTETILHSFDDISGGISPFAGLIFDSAGNLYSTTQYGGTGRDCKYTLSCGTVFKLTPNSDGSWTESVLYSFQGHADGGQPDAGVVFDGSGNLYGTTQSAGKYGFGVVFKLAPKNSEGNWSETVLYGFRGKADGAQPNAGVVLDGSGNLYGTTSSGGFEERGVVFKLAPESGGRWTYSKPHLFWGTPSQYPLDSLVLDSAGNLYGTTYDCGPFVECYGSVFEISP